MTGNARFGQTSADALAAMNSGAEHLRRAMTDDDLRYAGVTMAVHRLYADLEQEIGKTRRGRLALRLAALWSRLSAPRSRR
ncbi:hypothetical protein [Streptomyces graminilatus]|uniref:hypothetical protein n=1 Tax=Streptomyces graminilatus TaxID=1464070 RepID=UPI0006E44268|nr:hypothetical protein [Streptomyces graminilatus]